MIINRKIVFLLFLASYFLLPTFLPAQWLETTIYLPDSLCGVCLPEVFTYNATNNKMYVGGYSGHGVIVFDGATHRKIARISAGRDVRTLCWNSTSNKVYCADYDGGKVTVIDGVTNAVIATVAVGSNPQALCWNQTNNKIYCANAKSNNVTVIDGASNSIITTIGVWSNPRALCWNATDNKIYCANGNSNAVTIIDGVTDSVITWSWPGMFLLLFVGMRLTTRSTALIFLVMI